MASRLAALVAVALLGGVVVLTALARPPADRGGEERQLLTGRVVDERGRPLPGADVELGGDVRVLSDEAGRFSAAVQGGPRLISARAVDHLPRTLAAEPGTPTEVLLTSQAASTVSVRFGGDVMFGRRYYDPDEDGEVGDGLLTPTSSVADHARLLRHVEPLLAEADLTVVNLETPLLEEPFVDPRLPRPVGFHPTKEFVFASAPASVQALLESGVGAVSLGNNHVLDALRPGLDETLDALEAAGMPHFGAGRTVDEAWEPAVVVRKGQRLALLACTTITGTEHAIRYVADETGGGAAQCSVERLAAEVRAVRPVVDAVVVMVHGGEEYEADQTELVRRLTLEATAAGAALVVNGHPHVVGGVALEGGALAAETMGNLLFDQTVWPTFLSYLLRVDVRAGLPVVATVDPLLLQGFVPRPTVGLLASAAGRRAAGLLPGPGRLRQPGAVILAGPTRSAARASVELRTDAVTGLVPGTWVEDPTAGVVLGEDLLWTGSFEDMDTDPETSGAHEWAFGSNVRRIPEAACGAGTGMELRRSPVSEDDVVLSPTHRQLVSSGDTLSLVSGVRGASDGATLELALFPDTKGPSTSTLRVPVPGGDRGPDECRQVRLDAVVPEGVVAVQPFVRLAPASGTVRAAHLSVDDVRLVRWGPPDATGRRYDTVLADRDVALPVVDDRATP
jgi:hypothetical protein